MRTGLNDTAVCYYARSMHAPTHEPAPEPKPEPDRAEPVSPCLRNAKAALSNVNQRTRENMHGQQKSTVSDLTLLVGPPKAKKRLASKLKGSSPRVPPFVSTAPDDSDETSR